jgi:hypothetical protein
MNYHLRAFLLICAGVVFGGAVWATENKSAPRKMEPLAVVAPPVRVISSNPIVKSAAKAGVRACLERIDQLTTFVSSNAEASAFLFPAPNNADKQIFSLSLELLAPDMLAYTSASFAPSGVNACSGTYEAISYWPMNCQQTFTKEFAQLKPVGVIKRAIQILDGGPTMRVFLMPAGEGCIAIKKEVIFY